MIAGLGHCAIGAGCDERPRGTALHSNTARAHDLRKTGDWVVIYYATDGQPEG